MLRNRFDENLAGYRGDLEEEKSRRLWSADFILVFGVLVLFRAVAEYIRLRRMRAMINSTPLTYGF